MANITRYYPSHEEISLHEAMNNLFENSVIPRFGLTGRGMASNLYETVESFVFQMPMPGGMPENVEITAEPNSISLTWSTHVTQLKNATMHWNGFTEGEYRQSFNAAYDDQCG